MNCIEIVKQQQAVDKDMSKSLQKIEDLEADLVHENAVKDTCIKMREQLDKEFKEASKGIDKLTKDSFIDDFIRASMFTTRCDDTRPILQTVCIKDNTLAGLDGYKLIQIHNDNIPEPLKNKLIHWCVREDFENNIYERPAKDFIKFDNVIPKENEITCIIKDVTVKSFNELLKTQIVKGDSLTLVKINYDEADIFVNKKFIDLALKALGRETFTVKLINHVSPVIFENTHMTILLLPVRMLNNLDF